MVALNFKAQFAEAVELRAKRRSIRARRKDGRDPKRGDNLQLYTGMRQKGCRKLADAKCTNVCAVTIDHFGVVLDGKPLPVHESVAFARADGFQSFAEMCSFFDKEHGLPFSGLLIEWQ